MWIEHTMEKMDTIVVLSENENEQHPVEYTGSLNLKGQLARINCWMHRAQSEANEWSSEHNILMES